MVKPRMILQFQYGDDGAGWLASNNGLGPAFIKAFWLTVDQKPVSSWREMTILLGLNQQLKFGFLLPSRATVFTAGLTNTWFWLKPGAEADELNRVAHRVNLTICYCSAYDECWTDSLKDAAPIVVPECVETPPFSPE